MAWICLALAGLLEVVWAVGLKYSEGFTRLVPSVVTAVAAAATPPAPGTITRDLDVPAMLRPCPLPGWPATTKCGLRAKNVVIFCLRRSAHRV
mgnify:CR=1 FL=1